MLRELFPIPCGDGFFFDDVKDMMGKKIIKSDVQELDDKYQVEMDLPGFTKEDVKIKIEDSRLNVQMLAGKEENVLARIGDCIQINTDTDITKGNTMMAVQADVGVKTSFMQKIADWADSEWNYDDMYMVQYKSVLGY